MSIAVNNGGKINNTRRSIYYIPRRSREGLGIWFIEGLYELIDKGALDPEGIKEICLIAGTSRGQLLNGKRYTRFSVYPSSMPDIEAFLRENKLPYEKSKNELAVYSDSPAQDLISRYMYEIENARKEGDIKAEESALIDLALTIGYPSCCATAYGKFGIKRKPIIDHPFFEDCRKRLNELYEGYLSPERISTIAIRDHLINGDVYDTSLLLRGENIIPHSIYCENAISMCKEWEEFLLRVEDLLYPKFGTEYSIINPVKDSRAMADAFAIKRQNIRN